MCVCCFFGCALKFKTPTYWLKTNGYGRCWERPKRIGWNERQWNERQQLRAYVNKGVKKWDAHVDPLLKLRGYEFCDGKL